jgi:hypothetical protein
MCVTNHDICHLGVYDPESETEDESAETHEVAVHQEECSLRLTLDEDAGVQTGPDIFIERRTDHWLICLHPDDKDPLVSMELYAGKLRLEFGRGMQHNIKEVVLPLD